MQSPSFYQDQIYEQIPEVFISDIDREIDTLPNEFKVQLVENQKEPREWLPSERKEFWYTNRGIYVLKK